jgi:hypothetical protein
MTRAANTGYPHICVDYDIHEHNDCIYAITQQTRKTRMALNSAGF